LLPDEHARVNEHIGSTEALHGEIGNCVISDQSGFSQRRGASVRNEKRMRAALSSVGLLGRFMLMARREIVVARLRLCRARDQTLRVGAYQGDNQNDDM
jgi:hypothetical protein